MSAASAQPDAAFEDHFELECAPLPQLPYPTPTTLPLPLTRCAPLLPYPSYPTPAAEQVRAAAPPLPRGGRVRQRARGGGLGLGIGLGLGFGFGFGLGLGLANPNPNPNPNPKPGQVGARLRALPGSLKPAGLGGATEAAWRAACAALDATPSDAAMRARLP